ncbi:hypothetical protein AYI68_g3495 [Smittium mucronatum]|uniref:Uncharacterized protein n=1 Tax=Smittium mucronatum TaxID=133383 RepID=A0A1R0GZQ9_9FUNG|nr:hypothetical protein AYI68_g3495 [Smittium mucronatum]
MVSVVKHGPEDPIESLVSIIDVPTRGTEELIYRNFLKINEIEVKFIHEHIHKEPQKFKEKLETNGFFEAYERKAS